MAKLPNSERYIQLTIGDMLVGEYGFAVPWAMWVRDDGECFLNEEYSIHRQYGGTVTMKVTRVESGYIVSIDSNKHKWTTTTTPGYMSDPESYYGKVVKFEEDFSVSIEPDHSPYMRKSSNRKTLLQRLCSMFLSKN